ncbi:hypothetical protein ACFPJ4_12785 [Lysinimonas soli]|uniref:DUF3885 domain-containing protein n=1 Tax=Lysinimonas soli TaxID=1074233 RepID=A0ABW0NSY4_9MICO
MSARDFLWSLRWRLSVATRRLRGIRGDFEQGELSARAAALTSRWVTRWPEFAPSPTGQTHLHSRYSGEFIRFHSLPDAGTRPFTPEEMVEAIRRHMTALEDLVELAGDSTLVVVAADWGRNDLFGAWSRSVFPGSWPWLSWRDTRDEEGDPLTYFWVTPVTELAKLKHSLERVVEEDGQIYITDDGMNWLYHPYDGGADIYLTSIDDANTLRARHEHWRPGD